MKRGTGILFLCIFLFTSFRMLSQEASVTIVDATTGKGIPYAHVCFESLRGAGELYEVTDEKGRVTNSITGVSLMAVSYVGFKTLYDTVFPGESYEFGLEPRIGNLDEVVVTAQYSPQKVDKSIYKVNVINQLQIERQAAANLTDLLHTELSIRVSQDGALGSSMSLQGLSGEHVKILVDGVPVIGRMNGNVDISQLNLYNVEHIEIVEGPMSVVYGSNASAGVVNLVSKDGGMASLRTGLNAYLESVGIYNFDGYISGRSGNHGYSVSGGRNFSGSYDPVDTTRNKRWKPKRQYFADGMYLFDPGNFSFKFSASWFNELLESKGESQPPYGTWALDSYFTTNRLNLRGEINKVWDTQRFLNTMVAWSYYDRRKNTYYKDLTNLEKNLTANPGDHDTTRIQNFLLRSTYSRNRESINLNYQAGIDMNYEMGRGKRIEGSEQGIGDFAGFLSLKWQPFAGLLIQPGLRAIYNTKYKAPLVYSINLKWDPIEVLTFRASFARGFRAPSIKELYLFFVDVNHNIQGNENLQAENSYHVNGSLIFNEETAKRFFSAELKFFYNDIRNVIQLAEVDPGQLLWTYVNVDQTITKGFQVSGNMRLYPRLSVQSGFGVTGTYNDLISELPAQNKFNYSPDVTATITYNVPWLEADLSLFYRYTGRVDYLRLIGEEVLQGYVEDYHNMDISLGRRFLKDRLFLSAGVKNLFDNDEIPAFGTSSGVHTGGGSGSVPVAWGRTFFIKAGYSFQKTGK
jgi:outer membrane receptor for ferrienterochelin and colicins